jgi:hypothetical protein
MGSRNGSFGRVRSECVDWLLMTGARHRERVLAVFIEHDNSHRAHRRLELAPPNGRPPIEHGADAPPILVTDATGWVGSFTNNNVRREADRVSAPYRLSSYPTTRTRAANLFALSVVLWEMLTGSRHQPENTLGGAQAVQTRRIRWPVHRAVRLI